MSGKKILTEQEINEKITATAGRVRAKRYKDEVLMSWYRYYYHSYCAAVEIGTGTTLPYISYKAYETVAKERGLL